MKRGRKKSLARHYLEKATQLIDSSSERTNLLELILHTHLLLEQALNRKLEHKMKRPEAFFGKESGRVSFAPKINLYTALYAPEPAAEKFLRAFNNLRNSIAHNLEDPEAAVQKHLAALPKSKPMSAHELVITAFSVLLLYELEAISGGRRQFVKTLRDLREQIDR